jgi:PAS domain S-box-containing protein
MPHWSAIIKTCEYSSHPVKTAKTGVHQNGRPGKSRIILLANLSFVQLVDIEQIRKLLEAQHKLTGILSALLDTDENVLVAVGWQDICTRFHRAHPVTCVRCRESDAYVKENLLHLKEGYVDYLCRNGLRDVAMPIIIGGEHLATLFTGQFFYDDEKPDEEFFRAQAEEFGFDKEAYLEALSRVPLFKKEQVRTVMDYFRSLVTEIAELGLKNLELRESRDFLDKIINSIADPTIVKDEEHKYVLVNDAACAFAGYSREKIIGNNDYALFPKEQADVFWEKDAVVLETGLETSNEEKITDAQGQKRMFFAKKSLYKDLKGDKFVVGVIRDITDLKQKELMLVQQNRQAALGEILDHIAHQWRQPLSSISMIIQMLEITASEGKLTNEYAEETVSKITALVGHMVQTINVFRDFYRPEKEKTAFRLKDSIDMSLDFIAPSLRFHAITAELDVNPSLVALGYSKEYAQVLLNLLGNAKNALVERKINNPRIQVTAFAEDKEAVVTITDNAGGIPASDMDRIFEPLFTTRKETGGTGVGLYMSKSIIEKNMGGTLSAANVDGGAQFRIEVPAS